jgi:multidrug resistance protein, MATE family
MTFPMPKQHKRGSVREMIAIAFPMVVSQACDTIMIFTDRLFLAKLGPEHMNASMGGGLTAFMMMSFFIGLTSYSTALVAQYYGAGKKDQCPRVTTQVLLFSAMAYIPILMCRPLAHQLFIIMGISPEQMAPQKIYFDILLFGVVISLFRHNLSCFFSGVGRTGVVMLASCTAMIVNIILNYVFVFGKFGCPALGIAGSAYGTLLGGLSGLLVLAGAYLSRKNCLEFSISKAFHFDALIASQLWRFGLPSGIEFLLNIFAFNATVLMFHAQGLVTATAATIVFNWDLVSFVPLIGVEIGVMSLVGRAMGAKDPDTAHRSTMSGLKMGLVYSAVILFFFVIFPDVLVNIFRPAGPTDVFTAAAPLAVSMVRVASIYVLVEAMFVVFIGALRGAGDTFWAMTISVSLHWLIVLMLFIMFHVYHFSALAGWVVMVALFFIFSFIVLLRYNLGHWRKIQVISPSAPGSSLTDGLHEPADL